MDRTGREVLVHISAPGGARDDDHHRTLAEGIVSFEPATRIQIFPGKGDRHALEDRRDRIPGLEGEDEVLRDDNKGEINQEAGIASNEEPENVGLSSSNSQCGTYSNDIRAGIPRSQSLTETPQRALNAPQGGSRTRLGFPSHKRCSRSTYVSPVQAEVSTPDVPSTQSLVESVSLGFPPSVVQDSQPLSQSLADAEEDHEAEQRTGLLQNRSSNGYYRNRLQATNVSASPRKRQRQGISQSPNRRLKPATQPLANREATSPTSRSRRESLDICLPQHLFVYSSRQSVESARDGAVSCPPILLPLEIHPPPPAASTAHFRTHITTTLKMLSERLGLPRVFNPIRKERELRVLERGYWLIEVEIVNQGVEEKRQHCRDGSVWPLSLFIRFWSFLADFIGKEGRAGWGVWCVREPQNPSLGEDTELRLPRIEHVKVYSWGEVVPHIYLVLFLASERRIKSMCAQWKDARDKVVIQMS